MKKYVLFFLIAVASVFFVACKDDADDDNQKLDVTATTDGIVISVPSDSDVSYINIFRRVEDSEDIYPIGQIIPTKKNKNISYGFKDTLTVLAESYEYIARYNYDGVYKLSSWSNPVEAKSGAAAGLGDPMVCMTTGSKLFYDSEEGIISAASGSAFDDSKFQADEFFSKDVSGDRVAIYNLCLAISTGARAATFSMTSSYEFPNTIDGDHVSLPSKLNTAYFNKDLTVEGIVYQRVIYYAEGEPLTDSEAENKKKAEYYTVNWSIPLEVEIYDSEDTTFSEALETIIVPLKTTPDDDFDYSDTKVANKNIRTLTTADLADSTAVAESATVYDYSRL